MGDLVQKVLESMIPELEDLQKRGLANKVTTTPLAAHCWWHS
jgi:hypothetical protein